MSLRQPLAYRRRSASNYKCVVFFPICRKCRRRAGGIAVRYGALRRNDGNHALSVKLTNILCSYARLAVDVVRAH